MTKNDSIQFGHLKIALPSQTSAFFTIFEDLADFFQTEFQSVAVAVLQNELKSVSFKPKPSIDHESDYTSIQSRSADIIFFVAKIISSLTVSEKQIELSEKETQDIYNQLKNWKRPPRQKWKVGDILAIPLIDNTFSFGQIVGTHLTKKCPILALFDLKKENMKISLNDLKKTPAISVYNSDEEEIANHIYKVLFNCEVLVSPDRVKNKKSSAGASLSSIGNAYFGLAPWNIMHSESYYDNYLLPEIRRPENIVWLSKEERNKYRLKYFNIDENNNYIK